MAQPENIVLKDPHTKTLKIIDFGTAQDLTDNKKIQLLAGTPEFVGKKKDRYCCFLSGCDWFVDKQLFIPAGIAGACVW